MPPQPETLRSAAADEDRHSSHISKGSATIECRSQETLQTIQEVHGKRVANQQQQLPQQVKPVTIENVKESSGPPTPGEKFAGLKLFDLGRLKGVTTVTELEGMYVSGVPQK